MKMMRYRFILNPEILKYHNEAIRDCTSVNCGGIHPICNICEVHRTEAAKCIRNWVKVDTKIHDNRLVRYVRKLFSYKELSDEVNDLYGQMSDANMMDDDVSEYLELIPIYNRILVLMTPDIHVEIDYKKVSI